MCSSAISGLGFVAGGRMTFVDGKSFVFVPLINESQSTMIVDVPGIFVSSHPRSLDPGTNCGAELDDEAAPVLKWFSTCGAELDDEAAPVLKWFSTCGAEFDDGVAPVLKWFSTIFSNSSRFPRFANSSSHRFPKPGITLLGLWTTPTRA
jgi:hypothetical protein